MTHYRISPRESPEFITVRVSLASPNHTSGIALLLYKPLPAFAGDKGSLQQLQLIKSKLSFGLSCFQKQNKGQQHSREQSPLSLVRLSGCLPSSLPYSVSPPLSPHLHTERECCRSVQVLKTRVKLTFHLLMKEFMECHRTEDAIL